MKYKMIVSDYDGTLFSGKPIPDSTIKTIKEYQEKGGKFVICTGRNLVSIMHLITKYGLSGIVISCQGAVIYDMDGGKYIKKDGFKPETSVKILRELEKTNAHINIYVDNKVYVSVYDEYCKTYEDMCGVITHPVTDKKLSQFVEDNNYVLEKLLTMNKAEDNDAVYERLKNKFSDIAEISTSSKNLVEAVDFNCTKGFAVKKLAEYYGIDISEVIAMGDSLNDKTMIIEAGRGIAVGNAVEGIKVLADEITVRCDENAVEHIIKKYGLGEK